ncbi:hypothetical protein GCM10007385_08760 [Tateyamaria omphalii]|nr:hypothetical protein GCM10007385_08760 [Tateyamaria omphalii]
MSFEIVGVQFDQTGGKEIPTAIECAGGHGCAGSNVNDQAVADDDMPNDHFVSQYELGVGEDRILCHVPVTSNWNVMEYV